MTTARAWVPLLAAALLAAPHTTRTQTADDAAQRNARQARAALDAMVMALGGDAWLNMKNQEREGHVRPRVSAWLTGLRETVAELRKAYG